MPSNFMQRLSHLVNAVTAAMLVILAATPANAGDKGIPRGGITEINITSTQPAFGGASFGSVGPYEMLSGTVVAKIDPKAPANEGVVYLANAPLDADGLIDYSADFVILRPANPNKGNHRLFYEVINRGAPQSFGILNKGSLTNPGNGFLMNQGYEIVWSGWQPEANPVTATYKARFPLASNVTKTVLEVYIPDTPETGAGNTQTLAGNILASNLTYPPYPPVTTPTHPPAGTTLTVREKYDDARTPLSPADVTFLSPTRVAIDLTEAIGKGMDQGAIFELAYEAESPYVGGVGFVSVPWTNEVTFPAQ